MPYHLAILDFDGTLFDSAPGIIGCMTDVFHRFGLPAPSAQAVRATIGLPMEDALMKLNPALTREETGLWIEIYRECQLDHGVETCSLFPGAGEMLEELSRAGVNVAVASNRHEPAIVKACDHFGVTGLIQLIVGRRDGMPLKPDPAFYTGVIADYFADIAPADSMMVGDTCIDMQFAANCGLDGCFVSYGYGGLGDCPTGPRHVVDSLVELPALLRNGS
jgi:phosphoglycolate phosphatase